MSIVEELKQLEELYRRGVLTDADFEAAKAKVIAGAQESSVQHSTPRPVTGDPTDVFGVPLILLPIVGLGLLLLAWYRISGEFMLLEARSVIDSSKTLLYAAFGLVIVGSAVLVGLDAARYGFGASNAQNKGSARTSPAVWTLGQILLWIIAYPWYLGARQSISRRTMKLKVPALLLALLFTIGGLAVNWTIDLRVEKIQQQLQGVQQDLQKLQGIQGETE